MTEEVKVTDRDALAVGAAFVMLVLTLGLVIFNLVVLSGQAHDASQAHAAICAFRQTQADQAKATRQYLFRHPDGAPALGLSAAQIQQSLDKEQAVVSSLSDLSCN